MNPETWDEFEARQARSATPVDMVLHCPACGMQHIDEPGAGYNGQGGPGPAPDWTNPPHRSHLCHGCGHVWRPADVPTNGVAAVKTAGRNDSPLGERAGGLPTTVAGWRHLLDMRDSEAWQRGYAQGVKRSAGPAHVSLADLERIKAAFIPPLSPGPEPEQPGCKSDPRAPHGFNRSASHTAGRYVCDCEGWAP